jgi:1,4-dihydroxy-2-naphthoate octaprenyltransferase
MGALSIWLSALRPKTLPAAAAPVVMGTAIAHGDGVLHAPSALAALLGALLIQIGTNFANDYFDHVHGADTHERVGPRRATAAGLISPRAMRAAFIATFAATLPIAIYLIARGGLAIAIIGVLSITAGILYTGGPRPLGYLGLGDVLVVIFFGPVAVAGTHYVQSLSWSTTAIVAGLAPGLLSTALLVVNNLRDVETDRNAGKGTLAVRLGRRFAKTEFAAAVVVAALVPPLLWWTGRAPAWTLLASAVCLGALPTLAAVVRSRPGDPLLSQLASTGRLLVLFSAAFALGYVV